MYNKFEIGRKMKQAGFLCVGLAALFIAGAVQGAVHDVYVAPDGSDSHPGTKDKPLATLQAARDALRRSGKLGNQPCRVILKEGVYRLSEALRLTPEDSGASLAIIAYRDGRTTIMKDIKQTRRHFLKTVGCEIGIVVRAGCAYAGSVGSKSGSKPNLLFIMTDQQLFDTMSCAGNSVIKTPNLDRIAREGAMFTNFYCANPVCVPARAVFLTGLSSVNARVRNNSDYMSKDVPEVPTFDSILKKNGYAAEYYGKWHTPHQFAACYDNDVKAIGNIDGAPSQIRPYQSWLRSKRVTPRKPGKGKLYPPRPRLISGESSHLGLQTASPPRSFVKVQDLSPASTYRLNS